MHSNLSKKWRKEDYQHEGAFYKYVLKTALNLLNDHFRKKQKNRVLIQQLKEHSELLGLETREIQLSSITNPKKTLLEKVISKLPRKQKEVIGLRLKGLTIAEISEQLNRNPNSVKTQIYRAIKTLREKLNPFVSSQPNQNNFNKKEGA